MSVQCPLSGVKQTSRRKAKLAAKNAAAAARDAELEPVLRELSNLSARAVAAEIERRGLGKPSYKTIARARFRLGLED
jgi:hypothetical protein